MSREVNSSGKKRPRSEETVTTNPKRNMSTNLPDPIQKLRLEAIFHPKFDNEKRSDQTIRKEMMDRVSKQLGYLEVTLKHSGSLVLWSGGQRYYSKNSADNQFTCTAEVLLRQHFERSWRKESKSSPKTSINERCYEECSRYLQEKRLTLAFEVVTAILGDHGDTPHKDFVMLTAIADRMQERFYTTPEVIQLAQKFRLPHNDSWMFTTLKSVNSLFEFYDATRETAMAQETVKALNSLGCSHVKSMYQHNEFQGEILEGIIIRYIPYTKEQAMESARSLMDQLASESNAILTMVPSDLPLSFQILDNHDNAAVLSADIRKISRDTGGFRRQETEQQFSDALVKVLEKDGPRLRIQRQADKCVDIPALTKHLTESRDKESRRIAELLQKLSKLNKAVSYSVFQEDSTDGKHRRWLCIIHIHNDQTFFSFHKNMMPGSMYLFRGFCIEMSSELPSGGDAIDVETEMDSSNRADEHPSESETKPASDNFLMLKMKFLPYTARTFLCRNKLQVLRREGPERYNQQVRALLERLDISFSGRQKWVPFLESWALFAQTCWSQGEDNNTQPPLTESNYLVYLKQFSKLYEEGKAPVPFRPKFKGVVFVVSLIKDNAKTAADYFAKKLEASSVQISKESLVPGNVCYGELEMNGKLLKAIKPKLFAVADDLAIVLFGCAEKDLKSDFPEEIRASEKDANIRLKKLTGRCQKMKQQDCAALIQLSKSAILTMEDAASSTGELEQAVKNILAAAPCDMSEKPPGALVFFPMIPGCGKSTILSSMNAKISTELSKSSDKRLHNLNIHVQEGDKVGKNFWPQAKKDRRKDPSCIFIADKNAPPPSWKLIGSHCSETNGIPIAVLPDSSALRTTRITGATYPDDGTSSSDSAHFYPFSLTYLAVCMARVLQRPAKSHTGKLDSGAPNACMVVIHFFSLYRHKSAEDLINSLNSRLQSVGAPLSLEPIIVPFFKESANLDLPDDLRNLLEEALRLQVRKPCNRNCAAISKAFFDNAFSLLFFSTIVVWL